MILGLLLQIIQINGFSVTKIYRTQGLQYIDLDMDQFSQAVSGQTTLNIILENTMKVSYPFLAYCFNNDEQVVKSILSSLNSIQYHIESNKKQCVFDNNALLYYQKIQQLVFTNNIDDKNEWAYNQYSIYQLNQRKMRLYVYSTYETTYRLTIIQSEKGECYNSCNNQGYCNENTVKLCQCQSGLLDSTCQITSSVINFKSKSQFEMEKQTQNLVIIPIIDFSANLLITIDSQLEIKLYFGCSYQKQYIPFYQSNQYNQKNILNGSLIFSVQELQDCFENVNKMEESLQTQLSKHLVILFVNENIMNTQITLRLTSVDSEESQSNLEMIYIISCVLGCLMILILLIVFIIYQQRKVKKIFILQPNSERVNKLKVKKFRHSLKEDYIATEIYDQIIQEFPGLLESSECQICLLQFKKQDLVKLTYCLHLFHQYCLDEWRKRTQTCPFCRSNLTQEKYIQKIQEEQIIRLGVIVDDAIQIDPQKLQEFQLREQRMRQLQQTQSPGSANIIQINTPGLCQFSES
ncbi:unnamed protein product [Paramecium pentaurelia]|uniref:RING-type domain-containing protein n=1 Tax=Paramecium pentaurelia TaxID=43138 RepID=A0A8S1SKJ3_9CILI|nr:unnamed protein product [Paramecium pentaurelia]